MPFCGVHLRGQKPLPAAYPKALKTIGDHLRKRRLDLGLRQQHVASALRVNKDTIRNWEVGRAAPAVWQWPEIIRFLGFVPFPTDASLAGQLKSYRRTHGLSRRKFARMLEVDENTVWHWECNRRQPNAMHKARLHDLGAVTDQHPSWRHTPGERSGIS